MAVRTENGCPSWWSRADFCAARTFNCSFRASPCLTSVAFSCSESARLNFGLTACLWAGSQYKTFSSWLFPGRNVQVVASALLGLCKMLTALQKSIEGCNESFSRSEKVSWAVHNIKVQNAYLVELLLLACPSAELVPPLGSFVYHSGLQKRTDSTIDCSWGNAGQFSLSVQ